MKNRHFIFIIALMLVAMLQGCGTGSTPVNTPDPAGSTDTDVSLNEITAETAFEGVYNYCHATYGWSAAEGNPDMMYLEMGEETDTEYQVIFRSYTGAFVYFYVDKESGTARMIEYVPALEIEEEAGTINIFDYLEEN